MIARALDVSWTGLAVKFPCIMPRRTDASRARLACSRRCALAAASRRLRVAAESIELTFYEVAVAAANTINQPVSQVQVVSSKQQPMVHRGTCTQPWLAVTEISLIVVP